MPSSLTRVLSSALDFSSHLPVSVYGTVLIYLALGIISRHRDYIRFTPPVGGLAVKAHLGTGICLRTSSTRSLDRYYRSPAGFHLMRHPFEIYKGTGILTSFPSTTTFVLALGADLPRADYLYPGNLRFSADGDPTRLFVYLYLHSLFHPLQDPSQVSLLQSMECSPTTCTMRCRSIASVYCLAPLHYLRMITRPVSYYALFKGMAASKPTSWLSSQSHIILHSAVFRDLSCWSGLFPFRLRTFALAVSLPYVDRRYSEFDWVW